MYARSKHVHSPRTHLQTATTCRPNLLQLQGICYSTKSRRPSIVGASLLFGGGTCWPVRRVWCGADVVEWLDKALAKALWPDWRLASAGDGGSLVAEQPRPRGTQLRVAPPQPAVGGLWPLAPPVLRGRTSPTLASPAGGHGGRTGAMAVDTLLSQPQLLCAWSWRARTPRVAMQGGQPRVCSQTTVMGRSLQAYCAPPRLGLAARGQRRCGHGTACVNSNPLYSESSSSRSHSLDDQSVSI